ncbi:MAG: acetate--CoA ligase family protein [Candidatus Geothermincolia bacterium]
MADSSIREALLPLFRPASVAVIGATNNINKWGYSTLASLVDGYPGRIYPVNRREGEVMGYRAYPTVTDIPDQVDLAAFVIPAESVPDAMRDCVEAGVKGAVIISAGFAETGEAGRALQDEVAEIARSGGIRFVGPNCMGFWSAPASLKVFMFPFPVMAGPIGFVSQGGNIGGSLVHSAFERGVGFQQYVSCGCTADIQIEDYIEHFGDDPGVKVILAYIEGLNDGRRFIEKVRPVTLRKPVVVLKPGRTAAAAHAIISHSGSLAGADEIYDAAFAESGVLRVDNGEQLLDTAMAFLTQPLPAGPNVAIITPGGSYGVLSADACARANLNVVDLSPETIARVDTIFPPRWSRGNPLDPAGDRNFVNYLRAPDMLLELEDVHSLLFMGFGSFSNVTAILNFLKRDDYLKGYQQMFSSMSGIGQVLHQMSDLVEQGDWEKLEQQLIPLLSASAYIFGTSNPVDAEHFARTVFELLRSGQMDTNFLLSYERTFDHLMQGEIEKVQEDSVVQTEYFLMALVRHWIEGYGKPVLTTSFDERMPKLYGGRHQPFPSGERAALVLSNLVRYRGYLEREGVFGPGGDPFRFTLFNESELD